MTRPRILRAGNSSCARTWHLESQRDVDMLAASRCAELDGSLLIGAGVRDLHPLAGLRAISGQLSVRYAALLPSLNGLEGLREVGIGSSWPSQSLVITDSPAIVSIAALRSVRVLPGGLYLENNSALETLTGLENVGELCPRACQFYAVTVKNNPALRNFSALRNAKGSLDGLELMNNWGLTSLDGLQGFTSLRLGLLLDNNVLLESLEPLAGMTTSATGRGLILHIFDNTRLASLDGLSGITRCREVRVANNPRLRSLAPLRSLSGPVHGWLDIRVNDRLPDLRGLEGITSVGSLRVDGNAALRTLAALSGIRGALAGALVVRNNPNLRSLHGLDHITGVGLGLGADEVFTACIDVRWNWELQSVQALAGISGVVGCSIFLRQERPLASFQILTGATLRGELYFAPAPRCFSSRESDRLLSNFPNGFSAVIPSPHWDEGSCRECAPCGVQDGLAVGCDTSSGRCRCPLGWMGENCSSPAPSVAVLPRQRYVCALPTQEGSLVKCTVRIALRRAPGAGISVGPGSLAVVATDRAAGALAIHKPNGSAHPVAWASETDGAVSVTLLSAFGHDDAAQSLRVGYAPDSQPAEYLEGTLPRRASAREDTVFPWCLDSGDCVQFAPQRILVQTCPSGRVPSADNTSCTRCGMFRKGANGECRVNWLLGAAFAVIVLSFPTLATQVDGIEVCALAVHFRSRRSTVHDVSRDGGRVVVSTWGQHHFHMWAAKSFPIRFTGTRCRSLDAPKEPFRARVVALDQLELLDSTGKSLQVGEFDSSMGVVQLPLHRTVMHTGWPLPVAFSVPALLATSVVIAHASSISGNESLVLVALALAGSLGGLWLQRKRKQQTPLARRLEAYDARRPNRRPKQSKRGEDRAISAGQLVDFDGYFQEFIRSRNMYYVVANIVKPLTAADQLSFAEYIGPSRLVWFASHFWGTEFRHFCSSIRRHAHTAGDLASQRYWICSFSINQHYVEDEVGSDYRESSFYLALQSSDCRGTCMVIDEEALPLTRSWCLFELLQTIEVEGRGATGYQGLFFCTSTGVLNSGRASMETSMALGRRLATLRLEDAVASVDADKAMIDGLVQSTMGGFDGMNRALRCRISAALRASKEQAWRDFEALEESLTGMRAPLAQSPLAGGAVAPQGS